MISKAVSPTTYRYLQDMEFGQTPMINVTAGTQYNAPEDGHSVAEDGEEGLVMDSEKSKSDEISPHPAGQKLY